jgi:phosphoenolpyruvate-protein kinase (PTS system EI component)
MVETPMETLALDRWLEAADFVALGCNDLLQHLCGADRDDPARRDLLDPYRPELFRFLREGAARAGARLARVQLCGLLPQIDGILPVLIGLGYRNFSCEPALIPLLARCVADRTLAGCAVPAGEVCSAKESGEVRALLGVRVDGQWGLARDTSAPCVPPGPQ